MKRSAWLVLVVFAFAATLGGCACAQKEVVSEPAPAPMVEKAPPRPEPVMPKPIPPKKDRN